MSPTSLRRTSIRKPPSGRAPAWLRPLARALFFAALAALLLGRPAFAAPGELGRICPRADDVTPAVLTILDASPLRELQAVQGYGAYDHAPRTFGRALNLAAARLAVSSNPALRARLAAALARHAEANAWRPVGHAAAGAWAITEALATLIPAYGVLRDSLGARRRDAVDAWIAARVVDAGANPNTNNQRAQHGANLAHLSRILGDPELASQAVSIASKQLATLRADGSFPAETARGRLALAYTARTIASLVMIAESTDAPGLYAAGLDRAVRFLLDADRDAALVDRYAAQNAHTPDDLPWMPGAQVDAFRGGAGGWVRLYRGAHAAAARKRAEVGGRVVHDTVGGWLGCL